MKKALFYLILLFNTIICSSQAPDIEWQNTIGGSNTDDLYSIEQTADGGYILGGFSSSPLSGDKTEGYIGFHDYWVIKTDSIGNIQWQNTIGGVGNDDLYITQTSDGGYILGGSSNSEISADKTEESNGGYDYWVIKLNEVGSIEWQNTIGGSLDDKLYSLDETEDGGFILGGYSLSGISGDKTEANKGGADFWVIKIDSIGNIIWQKTIGGSESDVLRSVQCTLDSGYILFGTSISGISGDKTEPSILSPFGTNTDDYWVIKLDSIGNIQWQNTIGGNSGDDAGNIDKAIGDGYFIGGWTSSGLSGDKTEPLIGARDFWIIKLNNSGLIQWQNTIGGTNSEGNYAVYINHTSDGGCIVGGSSESGISGDKTEASFGYFDYWIVKLDYWGGVEWDKTIGGNTYDVLRSVKETPVGGYILGGWSNSDISGLKTENSLGDADYWIIKLEGSCEPVVFFEDADGDGYGNIFSPISSCVPPPGYVSDSTDCNDYDALVNPDAIEICDGIDNNCDGVIDEGFDPVTYYADVDSDGYGSLIDSVISICSIPDGYVLVSGDCDDYNASVNPGAIEICDGIDNNCDGVIDEGFDPVTYYADVDSDGYGSLIDSVISICSIPDGYVLVSGDCDDYNASVNPDAIEICDGIDNNCDGVIDEGFDPVTYYADVDSDGYGSLIDSVISICSIPDGYVLVSGDCDDYNTSVNPGAIEICDGIDNNCDGVIDEGFDPVTYYADVDSDGYGSLIDSLISVCFIPEGYVLVSGDCDDYNSAVFPGATEILNGIDDDCDQSIDEGLVEIENPKTIEFEIYPTLNNGNFIIKNLTPEPINLNLEIYDLFGRNIYSQAFYSETLLYVYLPQSFSGVAIVLIKFNNTSQRKTIIVVK